MLFLALLRSVLAYDRYLLLLARLTVITINAVSCKNYLSLESKHLPYVRVCERVHKNVVYESVCVQTGVCGFSQPFLCNHNDVNED